MPAGPRPETDLCVHATKMKNCRLNGHSTEGQIKKGPRDEGDARVSVALARAGRRVATTLKSRYGDARAEAWDVGVRAIEACRDAVGGSDREALVAALATLAETREATATAPREDETAPKTTIQAAPVDFVRESLAAILQASHSSGGESSESRS